MSREPTRRAVVVLGMHRSGTSALTRALAAGGFAVPNDLLAAQSDNPNGFFEPQGVVRLNNAILEELGGSWQQPGPFLLADLNVRDSIQESADLVTERWLGEAVDRLTRSFADARLVVLKDPRINYLLPLWRRALEAGGWQPTFVLIHRNPIEVAASIGKRNQLSPRRAFQLWQQAHWQAFELAREGRLASVISYEDLLADPAAVVEAVRTAAGKRKPLNEDQLAGVRRAVDAAERRHHSSAEDAFTSASLPPLVRDTWTLLRGWRQVTPDERAAKIEELQNRFEDAVAFVGPAVGLPAARVAKIRQEVPAGAEDGLALASDDPPASPLLLLHYHLFKNAGTSVDEMLKRNFGRRWGHAEFEIPTGGQGSNAEAVAAYLAERPGLHAFSSHTALLPTPRIEGREVFPILFIRHPLDRLRSAYDFERRQAADTQGARLAKQHDFPGYLRALLDEPGQRQARNFQTSRLCRALPQTAGAELQRALAVTEALPFVGLVEAYAASLERLQTALETHLPGFRSVVVRQNASGSQHVDLDGRLTRMAEEIGRELYDELAAANSDDLALFEVVRTRYAAS